MCLCEDMFNKAPLSDDPCLTLTLPQQRAPARQHGSGSQAPGATSVDASVGMPEPSHKNRAKKAREKKNQEPVFVVVVTVENSS